MGSFSVKKVNILWLVLAGTLIHLCIGLRLRSWLQSPDQLAWGAELDDLLANGNISYKQLIHYPHEGGSFFVSLLALCLYPFKSLMPALSLAALVIDTLVRYTQARVAQKVFGDKVGLAFALFGILSLPSLLPWSFVNFGLHAFSSVFPFLLLYFAFVYKDRERSALYAGLLTGIAISFAFDNIVLVPAYLIFLIVTFRQQQAPGKKILQYVGYTVLGLLPYLACRLFIDQRFAFEPAGLFQGRDLIVDVHFSSEQFSHLYKVWYNSFLASFFINASQYLSARMHTIIPIAGMLVVLVLFLRDRKKEQAVGAAVIVVLCFIIVYSLSPLYEESIDHDSYVDYRHFSYILPLVILLIIRSLLSLLKAGLLLCGTWILVCSFFSVAYIRHTKPAEQALYQPAGWILAKKYGNDPAELTQIARTKDKAARQELMYGYGWGISTTLLQNKNAPATAEIKTIRSLVEQFPAEDRKQVKAGIAFSFSDQVTPRLDTAIYNVLMRELE